MSSSAVTAATVAPSTDPVVRAEQTIKELMLSIGSSNADNIADMTASEIFELSERLYAGNMKKQEETFDRVLKSLESLPVPPGALESSLPSGAQVPTATLADVRKDPNYLLIQSIYNENKRAREQREIDRVVRKNELAEQRELSLQREQLRQRFAENGNHDNVRAVPVGDSPAGKYQRDEIDEIDLGPLANFNIVDFLSSDPFTNLLSQVERDLADVPYEESSGTECARIERLVSQLTRFVICSELSEVFAVLDAARDAKTNTATPSKSRKPAKAAVPENTGYEAITEMKDTYDYVESAAVQLHLGQDTDVEVSVIHDADNLPDVDSACSEVIRPDEEPANEAVDAPSVECSIHNSCAGDEQKEQPAVIEYLSSENVVLHEPTSNVDIAALEPSPVTAASVEHASSSGSLLSGRNKNRTNNSGPAGPVSHARVPKKSTN
jgi:hypothetical protein